MKKVVLLAVIAMIVASCSKNVKHVSSVIKPDKRITAVVTGVHEALEHIDFEHLSGTVLDSVIHRINPNIDKIVREQLLSYGKIKKSDVVLLQYRYYNQKGECTIENKKGDMIPHRTYRQMLTVRYTIFRKGAFYHREERRLICLNGVMDMDETTIWTGALAFTTHPGKGLTHYTHDDALSLNIGEQFGFLVYKQALGSPRAELTTYTWARSHLDQVDRWKIVVKVKPGWEFLIDETGMRVTIDGVIYTPQEFCRAFNKSHYQEYYQ